MKLVWPNPGDHGLNKLKSALHGMLVCKHLLTHVGHDLNNLKYTPHEDVHQL